MGKHVLQTIQNVIGSWLVIGAVALAGVTTALAADSVTTFQLESVASGQRFGPYECREGVPIDTREGVFVLGCPSHTEIEFIEAETGARYGPYDFVEGRIVPVGDGMYTLVAFAEKAVTPRVPRPVPATGSERVTTPKPRPTGPAVEPEPEPTPKPAPRAVPKPTIAPKPTTRTRPTSPRPISRSAPRRRRPPIHAGVDVALFDVTSYDWDVDGHGRGDGMRLERTSISLHARGRHFGAGVGFVYRAEVDEAIDGTGFQDGDIGDGTGWWLAVDGTVSVWRNDRWSIDSGVEATYRMEDYTLSYESLDFVDVVVTTTNGVGTNTSSRVTETNSVAQFLRRSDDLTLSEAAVYGHVKASYASPGGLATYAGVRVLVYSRTDAEGTMRSALGDFDIELERAGIVAATAGVSKEFAGVRWRIDGVIGTDQRISVGLTRTF